MEFISVSSIILIIFLLVLTCVLVFFIFRKLKNDDFARQKLNILIGSLVKDHKQDFINLEINSILNLLQDCIENTEETEEYSEIEINTGKLRIIQGRLKAIAPKLDNFSKGYILSCLVHTGFSNNPFVLEEMDFSNAECENENFIDADLSRLIAREINWKGANLSGARLENSKLGFSVFTGARFDEAKLSGAYLNNALMDNCYLKSADLERSYLMETNLKQSYLSEANLEGCIMRKANLELANLSLCRMFAVNLSEANLNKAVLRDSFLQGATLSEASLRSSYLTNCDLDSADLWKADMTNVICIGTNFRGAYLKDAKFFGKYKDLLTCEEADLENLQDKELVGLFSSDFDSRYGTNKTNFSACQWWQAEFDRDSAKTLWVFLENNFPFPNGLSENEVDLKEYEEAKKKIEKFKL